MLLPPVFRKKTTFVFVAPFYQLFGMPGKRQPSMLESESLTLWYIYICIYSRQLLNTIFRFIQQFSGAKSKDSVCNVILILKIQYINGYRKPLRIIQRTTGGHILMIHDDDDDDDDDDMSAYLPSNRMTSRKP